ncbi:preprotein translocase subunit SecG [Brevundimonas sp. GN22]|uniref:preprotein translocase subunit SecG n=1 Tax=Brevundimonas pishanensis TaxID=2896315 RepID=UPI001FA75D74|nr:preprotein translocase subunit SecG [Brevundimonas pishanensis]
MNVTMLQTILLVVMFIISVALTGVILLQRSEGGALGMGGGNSGFMTARGAGNLLTRTTAILGGAFFICAIALTIAGNMERGSRSVIDADAVGSIAIGEPAQPQAEQPAAPAPARPSTMSLDDLEASLPAAAAPAQPAPAAPAQ